MVLHFYILKVDRTERLLHPEIVYDLHFLIVCPFSPKDMNLYTNSLISIQFGIWYLSLLKAITYTLFLY